MLFLLKGLKRVVRGKKLSFMEKIIWKEATFRVAGECYKRLFLEDLLQIRLSLLQYVYFICLYIHITY